MEINLLIGFRILVLRRHLPLSPLRLPLPLHQPQPPGLASVSVMQASLAADITPTTESSAVTAATSSATSTDELTGVAGARVGMVPPPLGELPLVTIGFAALLSSFLEEAVE
ncbi:hypothetical protein E2562_026907 [Oryza meyeriana var. granulata]|uniref:Uncharacterized protein n=1 Tax=Oryza meyeriana var. granulata TaxID=110450 RepID=A0A6G1CS93_9ORYZ|nr:hypothetical protein E2562_026907 [Oryza meyeriana var. granulata]